MAVEVGEFTRGKVEIVAHGDKIRLSVAEAESVVFALGAALMDYREGGQKREEEDDTIRVIAIKRGQSDGKGNLYVNVTDLHKDIYFRADTVLKNTTFADRLPKGSVYKDWYFYSAADTEGELWVIGLDPDKYGEMTDAGRVQMLESGASYRNS